MKRLTGTLRVVVLFTVSMALTLGCSDTKELSRPKAAAILRESPVFKTSVYDEIAINSEAFELGVAWGAWDAKGNTAPEIRDHILEARRGKLRVALPIRVELGEITGISDLPLAGGVVKSVEFTWQFVGLSPLLKAFASAPGPSSVEMQLYDDGWRLSGGLEITTSGRFSLSDPESSELAAVLTEISDRISAEARVQEEQRAARARRSQAEREAQRSWEAGRRAQREGDLRTAIREYELCVPLYLELGIPNALSSNALAWIYATSRDPGLLNGPRAVELALSATQQSPSEWENWDTLAAAYARVSEFAKAVEAQERALSLGANRASHDRLELYRQGGPYVDSD